MDQTPAPPRVRRELRIAGRWYYLVLIATVGLFAWVPFLHAAIRLKTKKARRLAALFAGIDVVIYVLLSLTPADASENAAISTIGGLTMLGTMIVGCVLAAPLRRMVYDGAPVLPDVDPAVSAALAARTRREEARKLATGDPLLARELHIGRPDLTRTYDDGGLVDLNNAPATTIAAVCDIPADAAEMIVTARANRGGPFDDVNDLLIMADLPVELWDRIRDRAVLLS